jgi:hypothetical protein
MNKKTAIFSVLFYEFLQFRGFHDEGSTLRVCSDSRQFGWSVVFMTSLLPIVNDVWQNVIAVAGINHTTASVVWIK